MTIKRTIQEDIPSVGVSNFWGKSYSLGEKKCNTPGLIRSIYQEKLGIFTVDNRGVIGPRQMCLLEQVNLWPF